MTQNEKWMVKYNEVKNFIENNKRNPSKYDDTERGLYYNWLRHNMKLYNSGGMSSGRIPQFEQLMELCERYKHKNQYQ